MTQLNNWIIGLIDRLKEQFPYCGFAYAYEGTSDQHVVELTDASILALPMFREAVMSELDHFREAFADESILFTDQESDFPLDPPILYATLPALETSWASQSLIQPNYTKVSWNQNWPSQAISAYEVLNSVFYSDGVQQRNPVIIPTDSIAANEYNYAMAV